LFEQKSVMKEKSILKIKILLASFLQAHFLENVFDFFCFQQPS